VIKVIVVITIFESEKFSMQGPRLACPRMGSYNVLM
jgi:hypothetical protein